MRAPHLSVTNEFKEKIMATQSHTLNNLAAKASRPKLFRVHYVSNATGEETPISEQPLLYDEAMAAKERAEKSGKYDLKSGYIAALRLTEDQQDRYEEKQAAQATQSAAQATAGAGSKAKKDGVAAEE
jgi:hypothetical protein